MLSDEQLAVTYHPDTFIFSPAHMAGLRAVEAAVRADVAREVRMIPCWVNTEEGTSEFDIPASHRDAVLAAIVSQPSTPDPGEQLLRDIFTGGESTPEQGECGSCGSCGEDGTEIGECPKSKRPCGHHCNHIWTHDECDWCGYHAVAEEGGN